MCKIRLQSIPVPRLSNRDTCTETRQPGYRYQICGTCTCTWTFSSHTRPTSMDISTTLYLPTHAHNHVRGRLHHNIIFLEDKGIDKKFFREGAHSHFFAGQEGAQPRFLVASMVKMKKKSLARWKVIHFQWLPAPMLLEEQILLNKNTPAFILNPLKRNLHFSQHYHTTCILFGYKIQYM